MIVAVGLKTGKIYAYGKYRSEVMRKLGEEYPNVINVYPEPLQIRRVRDDEMSILQPQAKSDTRVSRTLETV